MKRLIEPIIIGLLLLGNSFAFGQLNESLIGKINLFGTERIFNTFL